MMREQVSTYESGNAVWYFPPTGPRVKATVRQISASGKRIYIRVIDHDWAGLTSIYVKQTSLTERIDPPIPQERSNG